MKIKKSIKIILLKFKKKKKKFNDIWNATGVCIQSIEEEIRFFIYRRYRSRFIFEQNMEKYFYFTKSQKYFFMNKKKHIFKL